MGWFWWDRRGKVVVCEILGVEYGAFGIACSFGWMAAGNAVDLEFGENWEVFGKWVREKETGTDRKVRFVPIVEVS